MKQAWIVVDLGFGDAGKGAVTDFLVRDRGASLVVRAHGGAQAGHNVITPTGRHHTFSQFGAGSFVPGVRTLLGPDFLLHPLGMAVEAEALGLADIWQRTAIDARARLITPYQQAANRIRERLRGTGAHGTCGVGVGECVQDSLEHAEDTLRAADLRHRRTLRRRLSAQRARKRAQLTALGALTAEELALFDDPALIERVVAAWDAVQQRMRIVTDSAAEIAQSERVVFEGAQGVLLDEDWGFHPHTTWSDCTPASARALLDDRPVTTLGVSRGYSVRHGAGPLPTEDPSLRLPEHHNDDDGWQGRFRRGPLDGVLLRYACQVAGPLDGLVLTCLDHAPPLLCDAYETPAGLITALDPGAPGDLAHRQALGQRLLTVRPRLTAVADLPAAVERLTGLPVLLTSHGPAATDKRWRRLP